MMGYEKAITNNNNLVIASYHSAEVKKSLEEKYSNVKVVHYNLNGIDETPVTFYRRILHIIYNSKDNIILLDCSETILDLMKEGVWILFLCTSENGIVKMMREKVIQGSTPSETKKYGKILQDWASYCHEQECSHETDSTDLVEIVKSFGLSLNEEETCAI